MSPEPIATVTVGVALARAMPGGQRSPGAWIDNPERWIDAFERRLAAFERRFAHFEGLLEDLRESIGGRRVDAAG